MTTSDFIVSYQDSLPTQRKLRGRGNKIVVGKVVRSNLVELEEEVREGSLIRTSKELNSVVQGVLGKNKLLVSFQDG